MNRSILHVGLVLGLLLVAGQSSAQARLWIGDARNVSLRNVEASVLYQSWPVFEQPFAGGSFANEIEIMSWNTLMASIPGTTVQPGTIGFEGGPVGTRIADGRLYILPGARGPGQPFRPTPGIPEPSAALAFAAGALLVARRLAAGTR